MFCKNPFSVEGKWFKGNIHTHTSISDGAWSPDRVVEEYKSNGYDFIFVTDHNRVADISHLSSDDFLVLNGAEFDLGRSELGYSYHIVALGLKENISGVSELEPQVLIDTLKSKGAETVLAHPYWSGLTVNDIVKLNGYIGLEVFNSTCFFSIGKGHSVIHWDQALDKGKLLWGFAVDDTHQHFDEYRQIDICHAWIMVKMPSLTEENVMNSIRFGLFYSSNGPHITDISIEDDRIIASTSEVKVINFIANAYNGRSFTAPAEKFITTAEYRIRGGERYIRVECFDERGRTAWTNPLLLA